MATFEPQHLDHPRGGQARPRQPPPAGREHAAVRTATTCAASTPSPMSSRSRCAGRPEPTLEPSTTERRLTGTMAAVTLHTTAFGDQGSLIVFCHGLFGQGRNWTGIAKAFTDDHRALLVDLPHHGRSSWSDHFAYVDVADQVAELLDLRGRPGDAGRPLDGRQGGDGAGPAPPRRSSPAVRRGRRARRLRTQRRVRRLHPRHAGSRPGRAGAAAPTPTRRSPRRCPRAPCATSCSRTSAATTTAGAGRPTSRSSATSWTPSADGRRTTWPTSAVRRARALGHRRRVALRAPEHVEAMEQLFPRTRRVTVKGAGHWVHSQQPEVSSRCCVGSPR